MHRLCTQARATHHRLALLKQPLSAQPMFREHIRVQAQGLLWLGLLRRGLLWHGLLWRLLWSGLLLLAPFIGLQAAPSDSPAQSAPDPLVEIRRQTERGWWQEARGRLDHLLQDREQRARAEVWLLRAEVCYQQGDIEATLASLENAARLGESDRTSQALALKAFVTERFGRLQVQLERPHPLHLAQQTPLLDVHLQEIYTRTAAVLAGWPRSSGGPDGYRVQWLPSASGANASPETGGKYTAETTSGQTAPSPAPSPTPAPNEREQGGVLSVWLPAGAYTLEQQPVEVVAGQLSTLTLRTAPPSSPRLSRSWRLGPQLWLPPAGLDPELLSGIEARISLPLHRLQAGLGLGLLMAETTDAAQTSGKSSLGPGVGLSLALGLPLTLLHPGAPTVAPSRSAETSLVLTPELGASALVVGGRYYHCWQTEPGGNEVEGDCNTANLLLTGTAGAALSLQRHPWQVVLRGVGGPGYFFPLPPLGSEAGTSWRFSVSPVSGISLSAELSLGRTF